MNVIGGGAHTYTGKAGDWWSGENAAPQKLSMFLYRVGQRARAIAYSQTRLLHIDKQGSRTVYIIGGTQAGNTQMEPGRKLGWTFSAHTISIHTENPLEGFAISLSLMGPEGLYPFSKGVRFWSPWSTAPAPRTSFPQGS